MEETQLLKLFMSSCQSLQVGCIGVRSKSLTHFQYGWKIVDDFHTCLINCNSRIMHLFLRIITLPETNSSPLKIDAWKTRLSFWGV